MSNISRQKRAFLTSVHTQHCGETLAQNVREGWPANEVLALTGPSNGASKGILEMKGHTQEDAFTVLRGSWSS